MYLAELAISNFRRLKSVKIEFQDGLNIIVGQNNIGKTAIVDALRALLAGTDDPYPRFNIEDIHRPKSEEPSEEQAGDIRFEYLFKDLTIEDEADFLHALQPGRDGKLEVLLGVSYSDADQSGRLRVHKWCGAHSDVPMTPTMLDNLRSVYLQPLRDAEQGLRPRRNSQLSRLLHLLSDEAGKADIEAELKKLDDTLRKLSSIEKTQNAITTRQSSMLSTQFAQNLNVELAGSDFGKLAARLSLIVDELEIDRNGLGHNNLIFMAVVLCELAKNSESSYRGLIIEEPEAHLHPQLQAVLLKYLSSIESGPDEKPVQVFVTSHSPNFASIADLNSLVCLIDVGENVETFHPRSIHFEKGKREKLQRYLDVTRAEIFFARRCIFVEGAAELLLVSIMAKKIGFDLKDHGVSLISVEGLNFDSFLPLFGSGGIKIPVSVITDADPTIDDDTGQKIAHYPSIKEDISISENTEKMKKLEDDYVSVFHGQKTFEYDLALETKNHEVMLGALADIHPKISEDLVQQVNAQTDERAKAETLFRGMFERQSGNVQKGRFAQALTAKIEDDSQDLQVPEYITEAIKHVCKE